MKIHPSSTHSIVDSRFKIQERFIVITAIYTVHGAMVYMMEGQVKFRRPQNISETAQQTGVAVFSKQLK